MDQLEVSARYSHINPAQLAEFKEVAGEIIALARTEPGILHFTLFMNADETVAEVREVYVDSDAVLSHLAKLGAMIGRLVQLSGGVDITCYGTPSSELLAAAASLAPTVYSYVDGK